MQRQIIVNRLKDYNLIYEFQGVELDENEDVVINVKDHVFFKPIHIIMLAMGIIDLLRRDHKVILHLPETEKYAQYLDNIGICEFCLSNYIVSETTESITVNTAMPIRRVDREHLQSYIIEALSYFREKCIGKDTTMLNLSIAELINNVYDHASSPIDAYIFCQYFANKNEISVVVGDIGVGIPYSVNTYLQFEGLPIRSNKECIRWALQPNNSAYTQRHNKGLGLNNIYNFVKSSGSRLRIFSDDIMLVSNNTRDKFSLNPMSYFKGTIVEVIINIDGMNDEVEGEIKSLWD